MLEKILILVVLLLPSREALSMRTFDDIFNKSDFFNESHLTVLTLKERRFDTERKKIQSDSKLSEKEKAYEIATVHDHICLLLASDVRFVDRKYLFLSEHIFTNHIEETIRSLKTPPSGKEAEAYYLLGMIYKKLSSFPDYFEANRWFHKSANIGEPRAFYELGDSFENGYGVKSSKMNALDMYGKSCDKESQDGCNKYHELLDE